jgi:ribosomal protein L24
MAGKDKGKQGEVIEVKRAQNRVVVAGLNLVSRGAGERAYLCDVVRALMRHAARAAPRR